jgi:Uma2 family endonuclease
MSAQKQIRTILTAEEYLAAERRASVKSEYVNGDVTAMAGGSSNHSEIATNVIGILKQQLRDRPCRVFNSDIKVRIDKANAFRYPDVSGLCGPVLYHDSTHDAYCNPAVIFEVLSPSTEAFDRGEKFRLYRLLDSLFEYILVRQERVEVEVWTRGNEGVWTCVVYNERTDSFPLRTLDCTLTLGEIYEKVEFTAE